MTDGTVRSRFDRRATIAALRRAPDGTLVHLLYPSASKVPRSVSASKMPGSVSHRVPDGLGALAAAFGGAAYAVDVPLVDGVVRPLEPKTLRPLFRPDALDSLSLVESVQIVATRLAGRVARTGGDYSRWNCHRRDRNLVRHIDDPAAESPGAHWVELDKKLRMTIDRHPAFERRLARLAISEDMLMECQDRTRQRKDALAQGFAVPGLMFWAAGSGAREEYGYGGIEDPGCLGGSSGGGTGDGRPRVPQDLGPEDSSPPRLLRCRPGTGQNESG